MAPRRPSLVVVAGPNGSGKTTLTRLILHHDWTRDHAYINADEIAEQELGGWNSLEAVRLAARLADERRAACLAHGRSLAYETVFSTPERVTFLQSAKTAGFFLRLYFVGTASPQINRRRVLDRVARGGHDVPADKIEARYVRSLANLTRAIPIVDRASVYDNSVENEAAIRWLRTRSGQIVQTAPGQMPGWIEDVVTRPLERDRDEG